MSVGVLFGHAPIEPDGLALATFVITDSLRGQGATDDLIRRCATWHAVGGELVGVVRLRGPDLDRIRRQAEKSTA